MKLIDTHAHYNSRKYPDRLPLLNEIHSHGVSYIVDVGTRIEEMQSSLNLTQLPFVYSAIGFFPRDVEQMKSKNNMKSFEQYLKNPKVIMLGEIGLDYHNNNISKELQKEYFKRQIDMAIEHNLPISIHSRDAKEDTMEIISGYDKLKGIVHCFAYDKNTAEFIISKGLHIGVGGTITYPNEILQEAISTIPLNKIVTETDAPYLAPVPFRGKRNNSEFIKFVISKISELKAVSVQEVENTVYKNAIELLNFN